MKEQSIYVFNRFEYTGEEGYVEPAKNYTCCNCGTKLEKSELADHAGECNVKEQIEKSHNTLNQIDYSKLLPGMKVKIKSWDRMVDEYNTDREGDIYDDYDPYSFVMGMKKYCGKIVEIEEIYEDYFTVKKDQDNYFFSFYCIEAIIEK